MKTKKITKLTSIRCFLLLIIVLCLEYQSKAANIEEDCKETEKLRAFCSINGELNAPNPETMRHKLIITGIGRAGTTLLMAIFTDLGLRTGVEKTEIDNFLTDGLSGMENRLDIFHGIPENIDVVKSPYYICPKYIKVIESCAAADFCHVLIPVRSTEETSKSRAEITSNHLTNRGALVASSETCQKRHDDELLSNFLVHLVRLNANFSFLAFPEFVYSAEFAYEQLKSILDFYEISEDLFFKSYQKFVKTDRVHIPESQ